MGSLTASISFMSRRHLDMKRHINLSNRGSVFIQDTAKALSLIFAGLKILIPTGAHRRFLSLRLLNKLASPLKGFYWRIRYRLHIR